jgi:simple sugar transport system permease protein
MLKLDRSPAPFWQQALLPVLAVVITFALTSVLVVMVNASPLEAVYYFLVDPLSSRVSALEVLVKATPILLTGAAVTWAFTGGYFNIGAEGQLYAGAVAATAVGLQMDGQSPLVALPLMVAGGFAAGMIWALTPALMKVFLNIDEVVTTLLLNSVALFVVSALLNGPWRDPISQWPQSPEIADAAILLSLGTLLTLWYVFRQTALGMRMKAVGLEPAAARFAGINVRRTMLTAALVSGGIAGLAGVSEVAGIHYHLIDAISPGYGYTGILVATLGLLNPLGVAVAALFIGLIDTGGQTVSRALGIPSYLGDVIQATLLLVTLGLLLLRNYRIRWVR